jgi:elongation factor 3
MDRQDDKISDQNQIESIIDASGNTVELKKNKKKLSKREEKAMVKQVKAKIDNAEELDSDEEAFAEENKLWTTGV